MKSINVNQIKNTIEVSPSFVKKAGKLNSAEYLELLQARRDNPGFKIELVHPKTKANKNKNMTHENMKKYIEASIADETLRKEKLDEFNGVCKLAKIQRNPYMFTLKWFKNQFPEFKSEEDDNNSEAAA